LYPLFSGLYKYFTRSFLTLAGLRSAGRIVAINRHDTRPSPVTQRPAATNQYCKILRVSLNNAQSIND
jgi:hypothetical protein